MYPASLDPSTVSDEEIYAIVDGLAAPMRVSPGAMPGTEPGSLVWTDGTPWTRQTDDIEDIGVEDEPYLYLASDNDGNVDWRMSSNRRGTLCKGRLSNIKGAIPAIKNLARTRITKKDCELTTLQREV
eukprot:COSAG02_NODE_42566_length_383_cov_0.911972_1_plen_127_part_11